MSEHCENCGTENPPTDQDGYTTCCNEGVCDGGFLQTWNVGEVHGAFHGPAVTTVRACCGSSANVKAKAIDARYFAQSLQY